MGTKADTLRLLEWDSIRQTLSGLAYTPGARERLLTLLPFPSFEAQLEALNMARECLDLSASGDSPPMRKVSDLSPLLDKAMPAGAQLEATELVLVGDFCQMLIELSGFGSGLPDRFPILSDLLGQIVTSPEFARAVTRALEPDGTLKDSASPQLKRLRQERQRLERALLATLERTAASLSSDSVVTLREGRYVVSVPDSLKSKVPGIVHDRSQSGTTYFIEPLAVLDSGNRLRDTEADIRDEIRRILLELSALLREVVPNLRANIEVVTELDLVWTKSRWAHRLGGVIPERSREPQLRLFGARHPLLLEQVLEKARSIEEARSTVIPFQLTLDSSTRGLVISGPNTGGKTVCLKTVGLVVLLLQSGVPATVSTDSIVGDFDAVFADIGDDQSLALSLSTFSAHLQHVGKACQVATARSLVLLDELGVGTDPEEGGALALAVLEALLVRGAAVIVTTHYPVLKLMNRDDGRVMHAAFSFNVSDLSPTYELVLGRPGQSYALDVARRLGFPPDIVNKAESLVSRESRELSALLDRLAVKERALEEAQARQAEMSAALAGLLDYNAAEEARWRALHEKAESEARREASALVTRVRKETEQLVAEIRRTQAHPESVKEAHKTLANLRQLTLPEHKSGLAEALDVGMKVLVSDVQKVGEITKISGDGQRISVRIGNITYTVEPDRLDRVEEAPARPSPTIAPRVTSGGAEEVDVRGLAVEEAMLEVDSAIQAAALGSELRVIHGIGKGILKKELTTWFRRHAKVSEFRKGGPGEGSDGVTVLTLKP